HGELAGDDLEPNPARAELPEALRLEFFLEFIDRAEGLGDRLLDLAGDRAAAIGLEDMPIKAVVVMLSDIVEDGRALAMRSDDHVLDRLAFIFRAFDEIIG